MKTIINKIISLFKGTTKVRSSDESKADFNQILKSIRQRETEYKIRGIAEYNKGNYQDAIKNLSEVIKNHSLDAEVYAYRGSAKSFLQDFEGAIEDYNKALNLDPVYQFVFECRGAAKLKLFEIEDAIKDLNEAIKLNPNSAQAYFNRGVAKASLSQPNCLEDFLKAEKLGHSKAHETGEFYRIIMGPNSLEDSIKSILDKESKNVNN